MPRPKNPLLSASRIRAAALELVDAEGLAALSMRRLAEHLGVRAASLYNHVVTKNQLLQDVADDVMSQVDTDGFDEGWERGLLRWARSYRACLRAHPNLVPLIASGPDRREAALRGADAIHGGLVAAGWPPRQATMIGASVKYLVIGAALTPFAAGFSADTAVYDALPHLDQAHLLPQHTELDADSFELALNSLITGLRERYAELTGASENAEQSRFAHAGEPPAAGRAITTRRC